MGNCRSSPRPLCCFVGVDTIVLALIGTITIIVIICEVCVCLCCYNTYHSKNCFPNKLLVHFVKNIKFEEKDLSEKIKQCKNKKGRDKSDTEKSDKKKKDKKDEKKKKKSKSDKKESKFNVFKYKDEAMVFVVILTLTYAACQFWDSFGINIEQDNCVEGLDCYLFPINATFNFVVKNWHMPPLNCSEVDSSITDPILCYSYALDFGKAIGDAGGILASATVEILTFFVLAKLFAACCTTEKSHDKDSIGKESNKRLCCTNCNCTCFCDWFLRSVMGITTVVSIWAFSTPVISTTQPKWLYLLTDVPKLVNPIVLSLQILYLTLVPWECFKKKDTDSDSESDADSKDSETKSDLKANVTQAETDTNPPITMI